MNQLISSTYLAQKLDSGLSAYPLTDWERDKLMGMKFLSARGVNRGIREWSPSKLVGIVKLVEDGGEVWKDINYYLVPSQVDEFLMNLAILGDLHGIIEISRYVVMLRCATNPSGYNIDYKVIDKMAKSFKKAKWQDEAFSSNN